MPDSAVGMGFCHPGADGQEKESKKDIQQDGGHADKGELPGSAFMPQPGEGEGGEGFEADDKSGEGDVFGVILEVYKVGDGMTEEDDEPGEKQGIEEKAVYKGVIEMGFGLGLLNIPEIGGVEREYDDDVEEGDEGIDEAHLSVFGGASKYQGEIGGQQIVEESRKNGAYSIPHCLPG